MTIKTTHTAANESFSGVIDNTDQAKVGASIALTEKKQQARVDSRLLAEHLAIQHKNVLGLIDENKTEFEEFGPLAFETRVVKRKQGGGTPIRHALLNEDQSYFLLTLTRNTERTKRLKVELVKAFSKFRQHQQAAVDYLPFYHDLHDAIKALTEYAHTQGSRKEAPIFHLMYEKLINKACGLAPGQRQNLPVNTRVNITNATGFVIAAIKQGIAEATDYHAIYQRAKINVKSVTYTGKPIQLSANVNRGPKQADMAGGE